MDAFLKQFGNRLAWATLGLQGGIAALQLSIPRLAPALWCAPANPGSQKLLCGIGNASPWYLGCVALLVLITGLCFVFSSGAVYLGGMKRHGWFAYLSSAVVMCVAIIVVVVTSGELNEL